MGLDSAIFWDKGTEVPSLQRDNETSLKSCHGTGWDGLGQSIKIWNEMQDRTITIYLSNPGRDAGRDNIDKNLKHFLTL